MIISASRRTDIPRFFMEWLKNRLVEESVLVRNPMNARQVSRVKLSPEIIDCIVFWTKNPAPMLDYLDFLKAYPYYIQFTINPYENDLECSLPDKQELIDTFRRLSDRLGPQRMIWRYSPVILNHKYTQERHLEAFASYAQQLKGYTLRCNLSFFDMYRKISQLMQRMGIDEIPTDTKNQLARSLRRIAEQVGIDLRACGNIDLAGSGLKAAKCIDDELIAQITGNHFHLKKDPGQPKDCYCVSSIDIGAYNTCLNGCLYCYANQTCATSTRRKIQTYDPASPLLCSRLLPEDKVTDRKVKSEGDRQLTLPGL